ncbi:MAG: hypothetical protein DI569_15455 [Sphingopyxis macrogoltabida]|uniref:Uncharacterized protein n=1 Tax=Sphingopyxis macrogoltabida TaxID=33050 RepID=A0A2W5KTZ2_SPHMC|nr:MAG: hypothetical protein DI569_15455 [Sphingopyxis macrogoltabida]
MSDAEKWGIPGELIADLEEKEPGFPVWPQNMPIVHAFMSVSSQMQGIATASGRIIWQGLNYAGARAGLKNARIKLTPAQWTWLRVMENAAAAALNGYRG